MDVLCFILAICCWVFNSTPLHIVTVCLSTFEFFALVAIKIPQGEKAVSESWFTILLSILCLASGIICLCV